MRIVTLFSAILIAGIATGPALADPLSPPEEKPWSYDYGGFDLRSTFPEAEPNDVCPGQTMACGDIINPARISASTDNDWYEINLTAGNVVTIGTDASDQGDPDLIDSYLELYGADCSQARLTFDDDGGPGLYSLISNYVVPTTGLYHIKVRGYSATYTGYYQLFVSCAIPPPPPPNDTCAGATPLDRCTTGTIQGDLSQATNNYNPQPPSPGCTGFSASGKDIVYLLTLQTGDVVHLVYTTPSYDGSIYIVTDCSQPGATCVVGEDDPEPETINWVVPSAGTYYLIVDAFTSNGGSAFTLDYAITCALPGGACCLYDGSCRLLAESDCQALNGMWLGAGVACDPNPCPPAMGACCAADGTCRETTQSDCPAPNNWQLGQHCNPNPCPPPPQLGACCLADGQCVMAFETDCAAMGGVWYGPAVLCDPNPCSPPPGTGACCLGNGECQVVTADACRAAQGVYMGDDIPCDPNPCPPNPAERTSWGRIKQQYR